MEIAYRNNWHERELYCTLYKHEEENREKKLKEVLLLHSFDVGVSFFLSNGGFSVVFREGFKRLFIERIGGVRCPN
jgi:hypothetical protein